MKFSSLYFRGLFITTFIIAITLLFNEIFSIVKYIDSSMNTILIIVSIISTISFMFLYLQKEEIFIYEYQIVFDILYGIILAIIYIQFKSLIVNFELLKYLSIFLFVICCINIVVNYKLIYPEECLINMFILLGVALQVYNKEIDMLAVHSNYSFFLLYFVYLKFNYSRVKISNESIVIYDDKTCSNIYVLKYKISINSLTGIRMKNTRKGFFISQNDFDNLGLKEIRVLAKICKFSFFKQLFSCKWLFCFFSITVLFILYFMSIYLFNAKEIFLLTILLILAYLLLFRYLYDRFLYSVVSILKKNSIDFKEYCFLIDYFKDEKYVPFYNYRMSTIERFYGKG